MKKVIMLISALAMCGSVFVGLGNKEFLETTVAELTSVNGKVKDVTADLGAVEDQRDDATEKESQAKDKRNQASAAIEGVKQNLKITQKSIDDISADLKKVEIEIAEINLAVKKVFPDGQIKSAEELRMKMTMLQESLTEEQNKKAEYEAQLAGAAQLKQEQVARVKEEENYQVSRAQKLSLNGLVATVIAVNADWGFVMVNAGRQNGVSADSSLLVKRGNSRIARLRIVNLQDNVVVADVVKESLLAGFKVQPGDKVIFESVN